MAQTINVDVTPSLFQPTLYYHQGDVGRELSIIISSKDGYSIPSGAVAKIQATKPSGFGFSIEGTITGNTVSFSVTETMSDECGKFPAQIEVSNNGVVLFTANFRIVVQRNVHPDWTVDGDMEHPEIKDLDQAITIAVDNWLDDHPEATTTVQDWSLSYKKLEKGTLGFVTPEMYGAVGDGVADDIIAIRTAIQSGKPVYFSNSYYISEPITLVNGAALIGGETYDYIINLKTSAGAFIIPDNVRAVTIKGFHCQAQNNNETLLDINASSTRHIHIEGVRADNYNKGIYITGTLWDSTFKNMRIESNTSATDLYVETNHNCFNVLLESVYFSGGGIINVNNYSGSFKNCNFGLFQDNQIRFTAKSNILFISCNLECEQFLTNAIPIRLGTGRFTIEGCSFIENGDSSSALIRTSSSTWLLKITNCVESIKSESSTMTIVPADYLELAYAGSFQADDEFINIEYSGAYSRFSPIYPAGIPKGADNNHYPRGTMRYNPDLEEIQYTADGDNWIDALGNTNDGSTVIKLGNGWYLEFGQITITGDVATILYSRQRDGYVFVSIPETDFVGGIMNRIDVNDRAGTYCVVRCLMYDSYNKVWVPNQKTYKLYWAKLSN